MKKFLIFALVVGFTLFALSSNAQQITIKAVSAFPKPHANNDGVQMFIDKVNERLKGKVEIKWLGGPEVIAAFDQISALKKGTIDMILYYPFGYMKPLMPEAEAKGLTELAEWEERVTGAFKLWEEIFEKRVNAKYLGRFHSLIPFMMYTNKKITKLEDFKGMKIRVMPLYVPFIQALGASPVMIPPTEIHTAMERKVVDGFMWPRVGMTSWGLQEVTKYMILPGVFQMEPATMINLDVWKKLPADAQKVISETMKDMEYIATMRQMMIMEKEDKQRLRAGMEFVEMPKPEAEKFVNLVYEKTWEAVLKSAPDYGPKLRKLTSKAALPKGAFPWQD
ncbi:MAG: TRAP transporter substrate-binding protein DctP [Desulfobacterota bacterium]|nr:TRAP transporter substrate-binding protein DctP [Thermodesulfobacteriota bacterium]MDW8002350.1 TRAP transporter substrate-binding protein DctP [Deltaproteobacteria bacterium]